MWVGQIPLGGIETEKVSGGGGVSLCVWGGGYMCAYVVFVCLCLYVMCVRVCMYVCVCGFVLFVRACVVLFLSSSRYHIWSHTRSVFFPPPLVVSS